MFIIDSCIIEICCIPTAFHIFKHSHENITIESGEYTAFQWSRVSGVAR